MSLQRFEIDILRESVIVGNDAVFKCSIPSFVSDFVSVVSWLDSEGQAYSMGSMGNLGQTGRFIKYSWSGYYFPRKIKNRFFQLLLYFLNLVCCFLSVMYYDLMAHLCILFLLFSNKFMQELKALAIFRLGKPFKLLVALRWGNHAVTLVTRIWDLT